MVCVVGFHVCGDVGKSGVVVSSLLLLLPPLPTYSLQTTSFSVNIYNIRGWVQLEVKLILFLIPMNKIFTAFHYEIMSKPTYSPTHQTFNTSSGN